MKISNYKNSVLLLLIGCFILTLTGCHKHSVNTPKNKIVVTATTNFYAEVAKAVLGQHGSVNTIIKGSMDPHDFEPTTGIAKEVHNSNLVLANGLGYDDWIKHLDVPKTIFVGEDIMHKKEGDNEHIWYDEETMLKTATYLAKTFAKMKPQYKKDFYRNAKAYQESLKPVSKITAKIKKHSRNSYVAVSEPVFDYSLKAMGYRVFDQHFALATEEGSDPSYTDIKKLQQGIKHHKIKFFVLNTQSDSKIVNNMVEKCHQAKIPIVKVTETMPNHKTYTQWMVEQDQQILQIQKEASK